MGAVKYGKDTIQFQMFQDFWKLFQTYAENEPEENTEYWQGMKDDCDAFYNKYKEYEKETAMNLALIIPRRADEERRNKSGKM